jgi:RNase P/RNase MRP subunit POP5
VLVRSEAVSISAFRRLWASSAVSNLGDCLRATALPLLAASLTRDQTAIAAVTDRSRKLIDQA